MSQRVTSTWRSPGLGGNLPMALDNKDHPLLVGCRDPVRLLVLDTTSGRMIASVAIDGDTDDLYLDRARKRIYVSCGAGFMDVARQTDPNHYTLLARIRTAPGARTSFFDPELNGLYLAVPHRGVQKAEIRVFATGS